MIQENSIKKNNGGDFMCDDWRKIEDLELEIGKANAVMNALLETEGEEKDFLLCILNDLLKKMKDSF